MSKSEVATIEPKGTAVAATTPAQLLTIAVEQGADIDKLEKLMDLQQRWEREEARKAFVHAMTEFRSSVGNITKDRKGHNSKYATLAHTLDSIKNQLSANGLSHTWKTEQHDNQLITVTCCVTHQQGHQECTSMSANPDGSGNKNAIQAVGSTVSYLQRYTLYAILGLASYEQDDDGVSAGNPIDANQLANLESLMTEVKADKARFLKHFGIDDLSHLPQSKLKSAISMLEAKR